MTARPLGAGNAAWLLSPVRPGDWREDAACASADVSPEWFDHTVDGETKEERAIRHAMAKSVCAGCTVRDLCLGDFERGRDEGIRSGRELPPVTVPKPHRKTEIDHGTERGAQQHRRRKETPCRPCADASALAHREREHRRILREAEQPGPRAECGTYEAYNQHRGRREPIDDACRLARNEHDRETGMRRRREARERRTA